MDECFSATWPGYDNSRLQRSKTDIIQTVCLVLSSNTAQFQIHAFSAVGMGRILAGCVIQKSKLQLKLSKESCLCCINETANNFVSEKYNHINIFIRFRTRWQWNEKRQLEHT
jgi:hypothetical protein